MSGVTGYRTPPGPITFFTRRLSRTFPHVAGVAAWLLPLRARPTSHALAHLQPQAGRIRGYAGQHGAD